ncbi:MAG: hypothetical protein ACI8PQ_002080, partial [Planctomycetota bacterium]
CLVLGVDSGAHARAFGSRGSKHEKRQKGALQAGELCTNALEKPCNTTLPWSCWAWSPHSSFGHVGLRLGPFFNWYPQLSPGSKLVVSTLQSRVLRSISQRRWTKNQSQNSERFSGVLTFR